MNAFGLITEGPTDQVVIENILVGYFGNFDIVFKELQPLRDATSGQSDIGGWTKVLEYCSSVKFKEAFQYCKYIIIQIDTDVSEREGFDVSKRDLDGRELEPVELLENVISKLIGLMGQEFYNVHSDRIIFAISVHEIECWLLPLYYTSKKQAKTSGCVKTLNIELAKKENFTIDVNNKNQKFHDKITQQFWKKKVLNIAYPKNPSFKYFIDHLKDKEVNL